MKKKSRPFVGPIKKKNEKSVCKKNKKLAKSRPDTPGRLPPMCTYDTACGFIVVGGWLVVGGMGRIFNRKLLFFNVKIDPHVLIY